MACYGGSQGKTVTDPTQNVPTPADTPAEPNLHAPLPPSDDLAKFAMTSPVEIAHHLRRASTSGTLVTVFAHHGKTFILTRLLAIDAKAGKLAFDVGTTDDVNRKILSSDRNVFVCMPDGVKTQFVTGPAKMIKWEGRDAFVVSMPTEVIKLQRREYFRIQTPIASPLMCHVHDYVDGDARGLSLSLYDISLGGLSLVLPGDIPGFELGALYSDCSLDLRQLGSLPVVLEVRNKLVMQQKNGLEQRRIGCMFVNPSGAVENQLQRYIAQLERDRHALLRD